MISPLPPHTLLTETSRCRYVKLFNWARFVVNSSDQSCLNGIMYALTANSDTNLSQGDTNLSVASVYLPH